MLAKDAGFLDSDDNARGSRKTITVVCSISDVQLKIPRKLFKFPVNSSAAVNSLENSLKRVINILVLAYTENLLDFPSLP
jgi:hypothetical protein